MLHLFYIGHPLLRLSTGGNANDDDVAGRQNRCDCNTYQGGEREKNIFDPSEDMNSKKEK